MNDVGVKSILFSLAITSVLLGGSFARAQIIGINFEGSGAASNGTITAPTGVINAVTWNNIAGFTGTVTGLTETNGIDTSGDMTLATASVTFTSHDDYRSGNANLGNILNGYLDGNGAPLANGTVTVSITNIPFTLYDVYVYVGADGNGRTGDGIIGSTDLSFSSDVAGATSFTVNDDPMLDHPSANVLLFTNVSGATLSYLQNASSNNNSTGVMAIEIVAVPEPATTALLGVAGGLGALVWIIRRRFQLV